MQKYTNNVTSLSGDALSGASVTVYTEAGPLATIYSDNGVTPTANPLTTGSSGMYSFYAADGVYNLTIVKTGYVNTSLTVSLQDIDAELVSKLKGWGAAQGFTFASATRNANYAITTGSIVWPDGGTGTYTADTLSSAVPGATDAWHATYVNGLASKTVTQPLVTRDANGMVTAQPAITVA